MKWLLVVLQHCYLLYFSRYNVDWRIFAAVIRRALGHVMPWLFTVETSYRRSLAWLPLFEVRWLGITRPFTSGWCIVMGRSVGIFPGLHRMEGTLVILSWWFPTSSARRSSIIYCLPIILPMTILGMPLFLLLSWRYARVCATRAGPPGSWTREDLRKDEDVYVGTKETVLYLRR